MLEEKKVRSLISKALTYEGCEDGVQQLKSCRSVKDWIDCYLDRIDFCLAHNYPSIQFLSNYKKELAEKGIYINSDIKLRNQKHLIFLGESSPTLLYDEFSTARIYVKHNSKVTIKATGNAFVMVDALDDTQVTVEKNGAAKVVVNLYARALCSGTAKIVQKYRDTYDLQDR